MNFNLSSLSVSASDWTAATKALFTGDGMENAGVFFCGRIQLGRQERLLVREFLAVPSNLYQARMEYHLEISPQFYNDVVSHCEKSGLHPVIVHSHRHNGSAQYSLSDDYGESRLLPVLQALLPNKTVASLLVTESAAAGRSFRKGQFVQMRGEIRIIGPSITILQFDSSGKGDKTSESRYDRQVLAIGLERQRILRGLKAGIIGLGGTGSIVAEQLARVGIGCLVLVDDDVIEMSNLSRVFGSRDRDIGKPKVSVQKKHLGDVASTQVFTMRDSAIKQNVLMALRDCDVIFSCVDNDRTRAILNRFAHQYLIPVIDMGVRLDARAGNINAVAGRVSVVGPDLTCLRCSHHLNSERIRAESMSASERARLANEGYVMGIDDPAPAVASLNTVMAGVAVTDFLNIFVGLTGGAQPTTQIYDATGGAMFTVSAVHERGCDVCDQLLGVKAMGDAQTVSAY